LRKNNRNYAQAIRKITQGTSDQHYEQQLHGKHGVETNAKNWSTIARLSSSSKTSNVLTQMATVVKSCDAIHR